jgi:hypothetical protein
MSASNASPVMCAYGWVPMVRTDASLCSLRVGVQWSYYPLAQLLLVTMEPSSNEESGYRTGFGAGPTGITANSQLKVVPKSTG